jgi:hypothetical protein
MVQTAESNVARNLTLPAVAEQFSRLAFFVDLQSVDESLERAKPFSIYLGRGGGS